jgi:ParB/RepB/Spo0J family partition protein
MTVSLRTAARKTAAPAKRGPKPKSAPPPAPPAATNGHVPQPALTVSIPLAQIVPSPTNPRKHFDAAKLEELAASIRSRGVLQPVVVRRRDVGPLLDDATFLFEVAGRDTNRDAAEAATMLESVGVKTFGDLKKKPGAAYQDKGGWSVCPGSGVTAKQARALTAALRRCKPPGPDRVPYELVVGERRFRAARLAGLAEVPARVVELDDRGVLEVQVIENDQRSDVTPLERAEGYGALVDRHGLSVDQLAEKVGKSATTVRAILRLRDLPPPAKKAMDDPDPAKRLGFSVAELIARQSPAARAAAAKYALTPGKNWEDGGTRLPTHRDVKRFVEEQCQVELKGAPFSRKALDLVPDAGSCDDCPQRAGNLARDDPEGWGGVRADVCTSPACFRAKVAAHNARLQAEARAAGQKVLTPKECAQLYPYGSGHLQYNAPYVDLTETEYDDPKRRTYEQLVGAEMADQVVLAIDKEGNSHRLVPKEAALKIVRAKVGKKAAARDQYNAEDKERERKSKDRKAAAKVANATLAAEMAKAAAEVPAWPGALTERLRSLARRLVRALGADARRAVRQRRDLPKGDDLEVLLAEAQGCGDAVQLLALVAELVAADCSQGWGFHWSSGTLSSEELAFWKEWGIDPKALWAEQAALRKAKEAPKGPTPQEAHQARQDLADRLEASAK